jgi:signal transduction histidine kinase
MVDAFSTSDSVVRFYLKQDNSNNRVYRGIASYIGENECIWCVIETTTDLVQTEIVQREVLSDFCYKLSKPLSLIHGYIETLQAGIIKGAPSTQRCLEIMEKHSESMIHLVEEMLEVSHLRPDSA